MHRFAKRWRTVAIVTVSVALMTAIAVGQGGPKPKVESFPNESGTLGFYSTTGGIDRSNPFFQPLGQKFGTTCEHCHFASDAETISAPHARQLFDSTAGQHPLFSAPTANDFIAADALGTGGTVAERRAAYSLMLDKGDALVRRAFNAAAADFEISAVVAPTLPASMHTICVDDAGNVTGPAGSCGATTPAIPGAAYLAYTATSNAGAPQVWVHRRPLPTTNFKFLTTAAWDAQDTRQSPNPVVRQTLGRCGVNDLGVPTVGACNGGAADIARATIRGRQTGPSLIAPDGHAYTAGELDTLANQMMDFMTSNFVAQENLHGAGNLSAKGAKGGVLNLANQLFFFGINDVLQGDLHVQPSGVVTYDDPGFSISGLPPRPGFDAFDPWIGDSNPQRAAIARGQALFSAPRLTISGVGGLNGNPAVALPECVGNTEPIPPCTPRTMDLSGVTAFPGACSTCHDATNAGDHSTRLPINIGVSDKAPAALGRARVSDLPLFILKCKAGSTTCTPGAIAQSTDPGRAVVTGRFAHVGQFKGPILRGLAARPPFFHNGMATTLADAVDFYNARFNGGFTAQEKADLVAFLSSL